MDIPKDKGQTEYQVVSVFSISVVFATLDTEGTAHLRDAPPPTPPPPQPQKAVDGYCFTLTTKVANWKDRAHKLEYAPMGEHLFQGNRHLSCFQGTAECCGAGRGGAVLGELCTGHREPKARFSVVRVPDLRVSLGVRGRRLR